MAAQPQSPNQLQEFIGILRRRTGQVLLPAALVLAVGVAVANFLPKSYEVSTRIAVRESTMPGTGAGSNAIQRDVGSTGVEIRGPHRVREVLAQQDWPDYAGLPRQEQLLFEQRVTDNIKVEAKPAGKQGGSSFVTISYTDSDGQRAERFLNTLRDHYIDGVMQRMKDREEAVLDKYKEVKLSRKQAYDQVDGQRAELIRINKLAMTDPGEGQQRGADPVKTALDRAQEDLRSTEMDLVEKRGKRDQTYELFKLEEPFVEREPTAPTPTKDVEVAELELQIDDKRSQQDGLRPPHHLYKSLEKEIGELQRKRQKLLEEVIPEETEGDWVPNDVREAYDRQIQVLDVDIAALEEKKKLLEARVEDLTVEHLELTDVYQELRMITNDANNKREEYNRAEEALWRQMTTVELLEGPEANPFEILEYAEATDVPTAPNVPAIISFAAVVGLGLGLGSAFASEYLRNGYRNVGELTRSLAVPVLGAINGIVTRQEARRRMARRIMIASSSMIMIGAILWVTWAYKNQPRMLGHELTQLIDGFREQFR